MKKFYAATHAALSGDEGALFLFLKNAATASDLIGMIYRQSASIRKRSDAGRFQQIHGSHGQLALEAKSCNHCECSCVIEKWYFANLSGNIQSINLVSQYSAWAYFSFVKNSC